jgi:Predicted metal-dependent phosphoesterases (PHP family)
MNVKAINVMLLFLCLIAGASIAFYAPMGMYDLVTGAKADGFSVSWPGIRFFTEPFYALSFYSVTLDRGFYLPAIISWFGWVMIAVFTYCGIKKRTIVQCVSRTLYAVMMLATLFVLVALVPLPGPKLIKPADYIAVDFHSHTINSHDNLSLPASNLRFHNYQGYDAFYITEHNHTKGFEKFPQSAQYKKVFPGVQMATKDGVSVLLLSDKKFEGEEYKDLTLDEIINKAHQNNMLVIMPHWWKWHKQSMEDLVKSGIDGFEIYNCGYRNFKQSEQNKMIETVKKDNLLAAGSTDWHGWGYMTDVWTVFKASSTANLTSQLAAKPEIKVILYREKQSSSIVRFIFEPFAAFYYYMKNANAFSVISFMVWFAVIFMLALSYVTKYIKEYLPLFMMALFFISALYFLVSYLPVRELNNIIPSTVLPVCVGFCLLWFLVWRLNGKDIH